MSGQKAIQAEATAGVDKATARVKDEVKAEIKGVMTQMKAEIEG